MSEMERAHDAIGPAFEKLIADAEAELVARRSNSTPLTVATVPVRTVHANELSLEDFIENHALPGVPVVIQARSVLTVHMFFTRRSVASTRARAGPSLPPSQLTDARTVFASEP